MAPKVREDLVVPYNHVPAKPRRETGGMIAQTLPMAAMFMRNKVLSWSAFFLAVQAYLNEPINKPATKEGEQPGLLKVLFALIAVLTCYMDVVFPGTNPVVQRAAKMAAQTATDAAAAAAST
ncbi:hypothetical protein Cantr_06800 [Candida viswanathii]|uniref:Uncharacterized protein n=1 Tax=Candida viswanathii TaxID=5486 RepID=A0A367XWJ8_9ASCO|nr:hypothetical protein Cantr_06800 [Candida viswanathii]